MTQPCMLAYSLLLIKTCHRRGVHAMGGMAAQIPIKDDPAANNAALTKVRLFWITLVLFWCKILQVDVSHERQDDGHFP